MPMGVEHRPSPAQVMSQYEWKILDWDPKQTKTYFPLKRGTNGRPYLHHNPKVYELNTSANMKQLLTMVDHNSWSRKSHSGADIDSNIEPSSRNLLSKNSHCVI